LENHHFTDKHTKNHEAIDILASFSMRPMGGQGRLQNPKTSIRLDPAADPKPKIRSQDWGPPGDLDGFSPQYPTENMS